MIFSAAKKRKAAAAAKDACAKGAHDLGAVETVEKKRGAVTVKVQQQKCKRAGCDFTGVVKVDRQEKPKEKDAE